MPRLRFYALIGSGFLDEAKAWREWLLRAVAGNPGRTADMYGVARRAPARPSTSCRGCRAMKGASAGAHRQCRGRTTPARRVRRSARRALRRAPCGPERPTRRAWALECALIAHLEKIWEQPDDGIWEVRGGPQQFTHSKVMAWVAFDRAVRSVEEFGSAGRSSTGARCATASMTGVRARLRCARAILRSILSARPTLDASLLLIPLVGFLPAGRPTGSGHGGSDRALAAARRIGDALRHRNGDRRAAAGRGRVPACSFWLADNYVTARPG